MFKVLCLGFYSPFSLSLFNSNQFQLDPERISNRMQSTMSQIDLMRIHDGSALHCIALHTTITVKFYDSHKYVDTRRIIKFTWNFLFSYIHIGKCALLFWHIEHLEGKLCHTPNAHSKIFSNKRKSQPKKNKKELH